jgi:MFS transporter, ACS family, D-galactonate transporter
MQLGALISAAATGLLLNVMSWRLVFLAYALPGLCSALAFFVAFRDRPCDLAQSNDADATTLRDQNKCGLREHTERIPWRDMARSRTLWLLCGQQVFRSAGYMFFASWFPSFLQKTRDVTVAQSGVLQAMIYGAALMGGLVGGVVMDWILLRTNSRALSRAGVGALSMGSCGALIMAAYLVSNPTAAIVLMLVGSSMAAIGGPCAFAAVIDVGADQVPHIVALMNSAGNIAAAICPVVVGMFFSVTDNWNLVLCAFAGVYGAAALCWCLIDLGRSIGTTSRATALVRA